MTGAQRLSEEYANFSGHRQLAAPSPELSHEAYSPSPGIMMKSWWRATRSAAHCSRVALTRRLASHRTVVLSSFVAKQDSRMSGLY